MQLTSFHLHSAQSAGFSVSPSALFLSTVDLLVAVAALAGLLVVVVPAVAVAVVV